MAMKQTAKKEFLYSRHLVVLHFENKKKKKRLAESVYFPQGPLLYLISVLQANAVIVAYASQVRAPAMLLQIVRD
jgi:hypothetical protein